MQYLHQSWRRIQPPPIITGYNHHQSYTMINHHPIKLQIQPPTIVHYRYNHHQSYTTDTTTTNHTTDTTTTNHNRCNNHQSYATDTTDHTTVMTNHSLKIRSHRNRTLRIQPPPVIHYGYSRHQSYTTDLYRQIITGYGHHDRTTDKNDESKTDTRPIIITKPTTNQAPQISATTTNFTLQIQPQTNQTLQITNTNHTIGRYNNHQSYTTDTTTTNHTTDTTTTIRQSYHYRYNHHQSFTQIQPPPFIHYFLDTTATNLGCRYNNHQSHYRYNHHTIIHYRIHRLQIQPPPIMN
ncbi:unnamed protein product [Mytilus edulis]|uniref:Uncharacterized protein n=1 Tax=Mytilus edulis TaxID=6550 RepID=A0A8S3VE15_MYTED|nr:unnamed protein product [Mytilus edulis]